MSIFSWMDLKFTLNWFTVAWEVFHAYLYDFFFCAVQWFFNEQCSNSVKEWEKTAWEVEMKNKRETETARKRGSE